MPYRTVRRLELSIFASADVAIEAPLSCGTIHLVECSTANYRQPRGTADAGS